MLHSCPNTLRILSNFRNRGRARVSEIDETKAYTWILLLRTTFYPWQVMGFKLRHASQNCMALHGGLVNCILWCNDTQSCLTLCGESELVFFDNRTPKATWVLRRISKWVSVVTKLTGMLEKRIWKSRTFKTSGSYLESQGPGVMIAGLSMLQNSVECQEIEVLWSQDSELLVSICIARDLTLYNGETHRVAVIYVS